MKFSVYDYRNHRFDYYESASSTSPATGTFRRPRRSSKVGSTPEEAAAALPGDAVKIGSGEQPKGTIATTKTEVSPAKKLLGFALVLGIGTWLWSRRG